MKFAILAGLSGALIASGCAVISKHEALSSDEQAARELRQQKSAQEVSRMAGLTYRMQETGRSTAESRPDTQGAGIASHSD